MGWGRGRVSCDAVLPSSHQYASGSRQGIARGGTGARGAAADHSFAGCRADSRREHTSPFQVGAKARSAAGEPHGVARRAGVGRATTDAGPGPPAWIGRPHPSRAGWCCATGDRRYDGNAARLEPPTPTLPRKGGGRSIPRRIYRDVACRDRHHAATRAAARTSGVRARAIGRSNTPPPRRRRSHARWNSDVRRRAHGRRDGDFRQAGIGAGDGPTKRPGRASPASRDGDVRRGGATSRDAAKRVPDRPSLAREERDFPSTSGARGVGAAGWKAAAPADDLAALDGSRSG